MLQQILGFSLSLFYNSLLLYHIVLKSDKQHQDYYSQEAHMNNVFMPKTRKVQYIGFFHTGAYQEVLSGYGGIHHCLLPSPKHVIIRRNRDETFNFEVFGEEQNSKQVLKILGY